MKPAVARKPLIRIAVVESDPLRFVGFRALFDSEPDFELVSATLPEITAERNIDLVLLGSRGGQNLFDQMASLKASRPDLKIIVTGAGIDEETILTKQRRRPNSCRLSALCSKVPCGPRAACCPCSLSA
jgi:DNA-binding NarL/FixJ family response regulator